MLNVCVGVLANSKLNSLKIEETKSLNTAQDLNEEDEYTGELEISTAEFRKYSGDLFYNIFLIFSSNFAIEGENYFFSKFLKILEEAQLYNENNNNNSTNNEEYLTVIEVIIFFARNLIEAMNSNHHFEFMTQFMKTIIKSNSISNEKILHSFILLLKEGTTIIPKDIENFSLIIQFLTNLIKKSNLSSIACEVLLSISENLTFPNIDCFNFCFTIFEEKYDFLSVNSLLQITESLCNIIGILDKDTNTIIQLKEEQVFELFSLIIKPSINRIKSTYNNIMNHTFEDINIVKLEFLKNYGIISTVLKRSFKLNSVVLENIFIFFMNETILYTEGIYKILAKESSFIKELNILFSEIIKNIGFNAINFFEKLNEIFVSSYLINSENYLSLEIVGCLYSEVIAYSNEKKQIVSKNFQFLGSKVLDDISNSNNRHQIEIVEIFANFIIKITETISYLCIDKEFFDRLILIYSEAIQRITDPKVNKAIVKLFNYIISFPSIFNRDFVFPHFGNILSALFKSIGHFENGISQEVNLKLNYF